MKYVIQAVIIGLMVFTFNTVRAELPNKYVATVIATELNKEDIKFVRSCYYYTDVDDIKMLADFTNDFGYSKLTHDLFSMLFKAGKIEAVECGNHDAVYIEDYRGFWIFKIIQ
ncbi:MAG: hypothetical protein ACR2M7_04015 [Bdellovibrionales bacterium]